MLYLKVTVEIIFKLRYIIITILLVTQYVTILLINNEWEILMHLINRRSKIHRVFILLNYSPFYVDNLEKKKFLIISFPL